MNARAALKTLISPRLVRSVRSARAVLLARAGAIAAHWPGATPVGAQTFADPGAQIFFGYYDITPFSPDGLRLLAGWAPPENISPHHTHPPLRLGLYDLSRSPASFRSFGETSSWNWQQGCRLQWMPHTAGTQALYNVHGPEGYGAQIRDTASGTLVKTLPFPVYALSADGGRALTLDFARLHRMRPGYGYSNAPAPAQIRPAPEDDGVFLCDLKTGAKTLALSLAQAAAIAPRPSMEGALHYFNHLAFSPGGQRWMVTHLWHGPQTKKAASRILVSNPRGAFLCLNNEGFTSHYAWRGDDRVIVFGRRSPAEPMGYAEHDLNTGAMQPIAPGLLDRDGHQTPLRNGSLLTDTYPDALRLQKILLFCPENGTLRTLGRFYAPPDFTGEMRCDLHPRLNHAQDRVCVDTVVSGRRAMRVFPL